MKLLSRTLSLLLIASLTLFFANCGGGGDDKTPEEVQLGKLSQTWELVSAELDGNTAVQIDPSFTLTISGSFDSGSPEGPYDFSVTGTTAPSPWPPSGNWFFGPDPEAQIVRDEDDDGTLDPDDLAITYSIDSNGDLTMTFECEACDYAGARSAEVNGIWVFVLTPQ